MRLKIIVIQKKKNKEMKKLTPKARKLLARLSNPKERARISNEFNGDNTNQAVSFMADGQEIKLLKEMNALEDEHEKYIDSMRESRLGKSSPGD